jgi:DNA repair protein RadD
MLRSYQETIVDRMCWSMSVPGNDVISLAVGGGKTHVIAEFANRLGQPILIFAPSKELIEQDYEKLVAVVGEENVGIFSASMNSKEIKKFTIATIQSAYKVPELFNHYTVCIIDECQNYSPKNEDGMFNTFFKKTGIKKVFGLTGTPFRLDVIYDRWGIQKWMVNTNTITKMINRY